MIEKTFRKDGTTYKVPACDQNYKLILLEQMGNDSFYGNISCLFGAFYDGETISEKQIITYLVSKKELYAHASLVLYP